MPPKSKLWVLLIGLCLLVAHGVSAQDGSQAADHSTGSFAMFTLLMEPSATPPDDDATEEATPLLERTYGLYVPTSYRSAIPAPLIIALHGRFSSAQAYHAISDLDALAEARGAVVVYPETAGIFWNDGGHNALQRRETPSDDSAFIGAVVRTVRAQYTLDMGQLFLVGYDNGGLMAYRLACEGVSPFAGVAVVSALMFNFHLNACPQTDRLPVSMLIIHGDHDPMYPTAGGTLEGYTGLSPLLVPTRLSLTSTLDYWRDHSQCGEVLTESLDNVRLYADCAEGARVATYAVLGGGHDWFHTGADYQLNRHGISATRLMDGFFFPDPTTDDPAAFAITQEDPAPDAPRGALLYIPPSYDPAVPIPVVIALHGRPSSASSMAAITDLNTVAKREGFMVVYPEGLNNEWNSIGDLMGAPDTPQDDVNFLKTLMDDLAIDVTIDPERIYITGFSNGGFMTMRMACSGADRFAAFAPLGSTFYFFLDDVCQDSPSIPMLLMHGSADRSIPFEGVVQSDSTGRRVQMTLGVLDSVAYWAEHNQCDTNAARSEIPESGRSPGTRVVRFDFSGCTDGADIRFYLVVGAGHNWSGVPGIMDEAIFGLVNMDINASEEIWAFFKEHTLGERD